MYGVVRERVCVCMYVCALYIIGVCVFLCNRWNSCEAGLSSERMSIKVRETERERERERKVL